MSRLKIKGDNGWFAAAAGWQAALEKLSDGAFKLFVHISLGAERSTGRFLFRQQDLARALRKSRRSIGTYLQELEERQVCRVRRSSTRSAQTLYVEAIGEMLLERPCIRCRYSTSDRRLAAQWFQQGIELEDVRQSVFLGCGRKYVSWLNGLPGQPIGSLHYFSSVLQEVTSSQLSDFQSNANAATGKTLARNRPRLRPERRNLLGKTFPQHNRRKSRETR